jgi:16S rRNA (uracil1498-N3)-methyltransferase
MLESTKNIPLKIVAYEVEDKKGLKQILEANKDKQEIALLIGPEGGIDKDELAMALAAGWQAVSLGKRILRTETAGLTAMAAILYEAGDFGG